MKRIAIALLAILTSAALHAQTTVLATLEKEQAYIQMAVSIQEQIIECFDKKLQATFAYSFRINDGNLQSTLRSDSVPGFDININIYTDEIAPQIELNAWTVMFGKLTVSFREYYLNENPALKRKIMAIFEQEKERHEKGYYRNKFPKKPAIIYDHWAYAQLAERIFTAIIPIINRYDMHMGVETIYLDTYQDRFVMHARWMDKHARGLSQNYMLGNLSIMFQANPKSTQKTLEEQLDISLFTSGNAASEIKAALQHIINSQKQAFLEETKSK